MTDTTASSVASHLTPESTPLPRLRFVIPGGQGHLGRLLAQRLSAQGDRITTLTRSLRQSAGRAEREPGHGPDAWETANWDGKGFGSWGERLEHVDVRINLARRSVDCRYTAANRAAIVQSRVESTAVLGKAIESLRRPPRLWLNASTATVYRHSLDRDMDEATGELGGNEPGAPDSWRFSIDVARQWERSFFASHTPHTRKIEAASDLVRQWKMKSATGTREAIA